MPIAGGAADKLGNRYEALWAIDQLVQIVDGTVLELTLEPVDADESKGVEFSVVSADGSIDYWSIKRQTTEASGWTLALLTRKDDRGRSVLGDLLTHTEKGETRRGVFASSMASRDLVELQGYAANEALLNARLTRSNELQARYQHILTLCSGNRERARNFLLRTRAHSADELQLKERVEFAIRKLLYVTDGTDIDVAAVRGLLSEFLLNNIHRPITRQLILDTLSEHSIGLRDWSIEKSVLDRMESICDSYVRPVASDYINGTALAIPGSEPLFHVGEVSAAKKMLLIGGSGGGKSSSLASLVEHLLQSDIPVIVVRFDQLPEGIVTTKELGSKLLLPESPVLVLAGIAAGKTSVLIVDQLDAISFVSGRKVEMWALFDQLRREAERFPNMSLVVGCREFDLEHDHRMRNMTSGGSGFSIIRLQELSAEQVDKVLRTAGIEPSIIQPSLKSILGTPLHLSLFLRLPTETRTGVHNRDELFESFWRETEHRVDHRLGRKAAWTQVVDRLANWLSDHQQLSAPMHILDDFSPDVGAMVSERFLVFADKRCRFFHESFFDYAFARRFSANPDHLVNFLLKGEQHLFRRAQVRQILSFLRANDWPRYLLELEEVLSQPKIRFHIKRLIFQWLSSLPDPRPHEWDVLQRIASLAPGLRDHLLGVVSGQLGWFDVLDGAGFFDMGLSSGDTERENEAIWMLGLPPILEGRSVRVSQLLRKYRKPGERWNQYLRYVCRTGHFFYSREMFDLFLSFIDDGILDTARPGFAVNDDWWSLLYLISEKRSDFTCEAIGHWLGRRISRCQNILDAAKSENDRREAIKQLKDEFHQSSFHEPIITKAAVAALTYAKEILPRVAAFVSETAVETPGHLKTDPIWCFRAFGESHFRVEDSILSGLARSLEVLAKTFPLELDRLLAPFKDSPCDAISFLVLRAWTEAPADYADRLADYLTNDQRRLKVGYQMGGGGSFELHVSIEAVKSASAHCAPERSKALEDAILAFTDEWEAKDPRIRGWKQLELLQAMDTSRLSRLGLSKLRELQRKFPQAKPEAPTPIRAGAVGPPITDDAQAKMSDDQWLRAMQKYAGVDHLFDRELSLSGGERQLAISLMSHAEKDPVRFAKLAEKMSDNLPESYFDAIIRGITGSLDEGRHPNGPTISEEQVFALLRRVHTLPGRPCGSAIAWLFQKGQGVKWPEDVIEVIAWHAVNNPDPKEDSWEKPEVDELQDKRAFGSSVRKPDPHFAGINSARGSAAGAIAHLLFAHPELFSLFEETVHSLAQDRCISVRSCAVEVFLALLNVDHNKAITLFKECVAAKPILLGTPYAKPFVHHAVYRDFDAIWPVFESMLISEDMEVVWAAAVEVCLLGLDRKVPIEDVTCVETGTTKMREAAANVYAANVAHQIVGAVCRDKLKPYFSDQDVSVKTQAATAFQHIGSMDTSAQADLLSAFLASKPGPEALEMVARALENSPVQLPDLVCKLAELCVDAYRKEGSDISKSAGASAMGIAKIVVRLYAQTEDPSIQSRCLNIIDEMERYQFLGLSQELQKLDR